MADREIRELAAEQCHDLLRQHRFGRLAVIVDGAPQVFPVNYAFQEGRVAIRTDAGTKLAAAALGRVAFEIDGIDEAARTGWSVLVTGTGYDVTESIDEASDHLRHADVDVWVPGPHCRWVRVEPSSITGREVRSA